MSELTPCNFCSMNRLKAGAKRQGIKLKIKRGSPLLPGCGQSTIVYADGKFVSEFAEIGDRCEC